MGQAPYGSAFKVGDHVTVKQGTVYTDLGGREGVVTGYTEISSPDGQQQALYIEVDLGDIDELSVAGETWPLTEDEISHTA